MVYRKHSLYLYLPILNTIIYDLAYLGRKHTVDVAIIYFLGFMLSKQIMSPKKPFGFKSESKKIIRKKLLLSSVLFVLFSFAFYQGLFLEKYALKEYGLTSKGTSIPSFVAHYYRYAFGPLYTFDGVVNNDDYPEKWYGHVTFYAVEANYQITVGTILRRLGFEIPGSVGALKLYEYQMNPIPISYNISMIAFFTYLRCFYDDFGSIGTVVLPFIFGFICMSVYRNMIKKRKVYYVGLTIFLMLAIFFSTMSWQFLDPFTFIVLILLFFLYLKENPIYLKIVKK
jgi:oligosaccharide repeat unit polymerase